MTTPLVADDGRVVCERCTVADRPLARLRGLLGRRALPADEGLLLRPTPSVHTCFMRFPIDVVFLDGELRVLRVVSHLRPWRFASCRGARATLELAAGEAERRGVRPGERLRLADAAAGSGGGTAAPVVAVSTTDKPFLNIATFLLARVGYEVVPAVGRAALDAVLERRRPAAVVFDVSSAGANLAAGVALLTALRPRIPVVAVTDDPDSVPRHVAAVDKWGPFGDLHAAIDRVTAQAAVATT